MKHGLKDEAFVLDFQSSEIDEKADFCSGRFQYIQQLRFVAAIVLISASFMEIRHYRRMKVLGRIEHQIGRAG